MTVPRQLTSSSSSSSRTSMDGMVPNAGMTMSLLSYRALLVVGLSCDHDTKDRKKKLRGATFLPFPSRPGLQDPCCECCDIDVES